MNQDRRGQQAGFGVPGKDFDRRHHFRRTCSIEAIVDFNELLEETVWVTDISLGGARLRVPEHLFIPSEFNLSGIIEGVSIRCCLVWRKGGDIGVKFSDVEV